MAGRTRRVRTKPAAGAAKKQSKPAGRVMSVRSRRARFNRAGLRFTSTIPVLVNEADIGPERYDRILNESALRCAPVADEEDA